MKFKPGDRVEWLGARKVLGPLPRCSQGVILKHIDSPYVPRGYTLQVGNWYLCNFDGEEFSCVESALRLIPGDDSRNVGDWSNCVWTPKHIRLQKFREFMDRQLERA